MTWQHFCGACGVRLPDAEPYARPGDDPGRPWLGSAGAAGIGCVTLLAVAGLLQLISGLNQHLLAGASIANGFSWLGLLLYVLALIQVTVAFLGQRRHRQLRLTSAAVLVGCYYLSLCIREAIYSGIDIAHHVPGRFSAAAVVYAVAEAFAAVALMVAAMGFNASNEATSNSRFGAAFILIAISTTLVGASDALVLSGAYAVTGTPAGGFAVDLAGQLVEVAAAVVAAFALLRASVGVDRRERTALRHRDRWLAGAIGGVALATLFMGVAIMVDASQTASLQPGLQRASLWLGGVGTLLLAAPYGLWAAAHAVGGWARGSA